MNLLSYLQEVKAEMNKVTWPSRNDVVNLTILVIIVSVIIGIYIGGLDFAFTNTLNKLLGK